MAAVINTTPLSPRPPQVIVERAAKDTPLVMSDISPNREGVIAVVAESLVGLLQKKSHTLAAAEWAVHTLIQLQMLIAKKIPVAVPFTVPIARNPWFSFGAPQSFDLVDGFIGIPDAGPAAYRSFQVESTLKLWNWWNADTPPLSIIGNAQIDEHDCCGVTLYDLALLIEEDEVAAKDSLKRWIDSKGITAKPIGKCPLDGRKRLYRLSELLSDARQILTLSTEDVHKYQQALAAKLRRPKNHESSRK
jgi:hypothetical protein